MARMRKAISPKRTSKTKRSGHANTVDDYIARVPQPTRALMHKMRAAIRSVVPREATEVISYRIPAFRSNKGVLVWYAAFSGHLSLFPTASVIEAFKSELKGYSTSKGTIHFPSGQPLPITLIKKIVKARVEQLERKK
jgi:uncharacterized protein YdhG (YjbR/CyaY superfamily)